MIHWGQSMHACVHQQCWSMSSALLYLETMWFPSANHARVIYERSSSLTVPNYYELESLDCACVHICTVCILCVRKCFWPRKITWFGTFNQITLAEMKFLICHISCRLWHITRTPKGCCGLNMLDPFVSRSEKQHVSILSLPLGGGLTSASPCWLEFSDCPDSVKK